MRALLLGALLSALIVAGPGCDTADPIDTRQVTYEVEGLGTFAATHAVQVRYTGAAGQMVTVDNVTLPFSHQTHIASGTSVTLQAQVVAPANQSGIRLTIRSEGAVLGQDEAPGSAGTQTVEVTRSITRTVP